MKAWRLRRLGLFGAALGVTLANACSSKSTAHGTPSTDAGPGGTTGKGGGTDAAAGTAGGGRAGSSGATGSGGTLGAGGSGASAGALDGGGGKLVDAGGPALDCDTLAQAKCNRHNECSKFSLESSFGTLAACIARTAQWCRLALAAPGSDPASGAGCPAALAALGCEDFFKSKPSAACEEKGTLPDGRSCKFDRQCASGVCRLPSAGTTGCGTCIQPVAANGDCSGAARCAPGFVCHATGRCLGYVPRGGNCSSSTAPCDSMLACVNGKCGDGLAVGSNCTGMLEGCNSALGQACLLVNGGYFCVQKQIVTSGQCGQFGPQVYQCRGEYVCNANSVCELRPTDGQPCTPMGLATCRWPSECTSGECRLPDPSACG